MDFSKFTTNKIWELFHIHTWKDLIINKTQEGAYPIITHSKENNWIGLFASQLTSHKLFNHKTTLSLADRGNFFATKQPHPFYIGTRVKALISKSDGFSEKNSLFIARMINQQEENFSYARVAWARLPIQKILLPYNTIWEINRKGMNEFVDQCEFCMIANYLLFLKEGWRISSL